MTHPGAGARILEVGAGSGRDSLHLAGLGARVTILDYSESALAATRRACGEAEGVELLRGDALALPFPDKSFDVVFHQGLLEHFRDPMPLLLENARVLAPGRSGSEADSEANCSSKRASIRSQSPPTSASLVRK